MRHLNELQPTVLHGSAGAGGDTHAGPHRDVAAAHDAGIYSLDERRA